MRARAAQAAPGVAASLLWIATLVLGMQSLFDLLELYYLVTGYFGGNLNKAQQFAPVIVMVLGLVLVFFVIGTAEYHRTRVGSRESWRLFGWTLGAELAVVFLHFSLL